MSDATATCGGAVAGSIFGTLICIGLLAFGAWWLYKRFWKNKSGTELSYVIVVIHPITQLHMLSYAILSSA